MISVKWYLVIIINSCGSISGVSTINLIWRVVLLEGLFCVENDVQQMWEIENTCLLKCWMLLNIWMYIVTINKLTHLLSECSWKFPFEASQVVFWSLSGYNEPKLRGEWVKVVFFYIIHSTTVFLSDKFTGFYVFFSMVEVNCPVKSWKIPSCK